MEKQKAKILKVSQGYTLAELITVLAIIAILGTMLMSMLSTGTQFYQNANTTMDKQNNIRLAIAYITVKIRQNDVTGCISIAEHLSSDSTFKVLTIKDSSSTSGNVFWIYFDKSTGKLREQSTNKDFDTNLEDGTEIADLSSLNIESYDMVKNGANLHFEVDLAGNPVTYTQDITLRSP